MDIRSLNEEKLRKLNSATKYPSILTYHKLGEKGRLLDELLVPFDRAVYVTEKVDGTNARIILFPDTATYILGSREDLLHARGDLIVNQTLGIVEGVRRFAENALTQDLPAGQIVVIFGELYGGRIGSQARTYTSSNQVNFRVFDVVTFDRADVEKMLDTMALEQIAAWRDSGGQSFMMEPEIHEAAKRIDAQVTPRLGLATLPTTIRETYDWLASVLPGPTNAVIDGVGGKPEGVVVRYPDRTQIAKIRFEDYERTFRR